MDKTNENKGLGDYENWMAKYQFPLEYDFGTPILLQQQDFCMAIKQMLRDSGLRKDGQRMTEVIFNLINDRISGIKNG
jgi:hypothetical protein